MGLAETLLKAVSDMVLNVSSQERKFVLFRRIWCVFSLIPKTVIAAAAWAVAVLLFVA